jgi:hypothetical protein
MAIARKLTKFFCNMHLDINAVFITFFAVALAVFKLLKPPTASLTVLLGAWILLPVGHYPVGSAEAIFPFWITGLATPSDMLLTKAWVGPAAALVGAMVFDTKTLLAFRPRWVDAPMLAWCAWPLLQSLVAATPSQPAGFVSALYLLGCWGLPWLLGRVYFSKPEGQWQTLRALTYSAVACLPFSLYEGVFGPDAYQLFFEAHPFRADGAERYVGFRPIGFFEHGNQFGIWVSLCALVAVWRFLVLPPGRFRHIAGAVAAICVAVAVAAQSIGALLLLGAGGALLSSGRLIRTRLIVFGTLGALTLSALVYASGVIPIQQIGQGTAFGQSVVNAFRAAGRGSFTWRISQDQKLLAEIKAHPVVGSAKWDWWRAKNTRPWGLAMLLLGQFGLVGLTLCFGSVLWPALREAWEAPRVSGWHMSAMPLLLATVVGLTMLDALMNSFIFFPAVLIAGGLAGRRQTVG